jgi:type II secretory pathway predicted ATPase ExeA
MPRRAALKRLIELVTEGGGAVVGRADRTPKLKNDLRRPKMKEIGDRTTVSSSVRPAGSATGLYRLGAQGFAR